MRLLPYEKISRHSKDMLDFLQVMWMLLGLLYGEYLVAGQSGKCWLSSR